MMKQAELNKLAKYLAEKKHIKFKLSVNDCNTLVMEWHDIRFGTDKLSSILGQYNNVKERIKFSRNFISAETWLTSNGYKPVKSARDGDILVIPTKHYSIAHIVFNGSAQTFQEGAGFVRLNIKSIPKDVYQVWRK